MKHLNAEKETIQVAAAAVIGFIARRTAEERTKFAEVMPTIMDVSMSTQSTTLNLMTAYTSSVDPGKGSYNFFPASSVYCVSMRKFRWVPGLSVIVSHVSLYRVSLTSGSDQDLDNAYWLHWLQVATKSSPKTWGWEDAVTAVSTMAIQEESCRASIVKTLRQFLSKSGREAATLAYSKMAYSAKGREVSRRFCLPLPPPAFSHARWVCKASVQRNPNFLLHCVAPHEPKCK